ncbi:MAG TPA: tyrosine-protein phosphatase [Pseudomonadales bacterium]|nr:tyrosine-protein phosphatase [Pseudomonadales bacterium]
MNEALKLPRFISLEGGINFRDFGGYRTRQGVVKWRKLFRSGSLAMLPAESGPIFAELKISAICDLRRDDEVELSPSPVHPPFDCRLHIPIAPGNSMMLRESLMDPKQTAEDRRQYMVEITRDIARDHHDEYRELFRHLVETPDGFLLHCTAGKDRTGIGAALILTALGVDEATIMEDYLLSNQSTSLLERTRSRMNEVYESLDDESIVVISGVRPEYLEAALAEIRRMHGSVDGYLEAIGVNDEVRQALRAKYVSA